MATVPHRTGQGYPVRRTVPGVLRVSGVAGFTVATPCPITVMWLRTSRVRSLPCRGSRLLGVGLLEAGPPAAFFVKVEAGPPSDSRPEKQSAEGRRPNVLVPWRPDWLVIFSEVPKGAG